MTELDTIYSFYGLAQLHMLMEVKINLMDIENAKLDTTTQDGR